MTQRDDTRSFTLLAAGMFVFGLLVSYVAWQEGERGFVLLAFPLGMGGSTFVIGLLGVSLKNLFGTYKREVVIEPAHIRHAPPGLQQAVAIIVGASPLFGFSAAALTLVGLALLEPIVTLPWHTRDLRELFLELALVFTVLIAVAFAAAFYADHRRRKK